MADVNVERKEPSVWPWVIGLLILALLIWFLVEMFDSDANGTAIDTLSDTTTTNVIDSMDVPPP